MWRRILGWNFHPTLANSFSLSIVIWFISCIMEGSGLILLEALSLCFGDEHFLVTRILSWNFLELVRKICTFLGLFLVSCLLLDRSLEEYKNLQPPPILSLLFVEKAIAKVARRSKMVYTLLDFTLLGLLSQGSKRDYTPWDLVYIT